MKMTFYAANCRGNAKNSLYPNKRVVDNEDDCMEVMAFDHVCAEFKNCRRSGVHFLVFGTVPADGGEAVAAGAGIGNRGGAAHHHKRHY